MDFISNKFAGSIDSYKNLDQLDFRIIPMSMKKLPFFQDDTFLGMQAINIGTVDSIITQYEYELLRERDEIERTPIETAMVVSALSQMWIFALYEVLRTWRQRKDNFEKYYDNGGIELKIKHMISDPLNPAMEIRKQQLLRFKDDAEYREQIKVTWNKIESVFNIIELFRINLAKHEAPSHKNIIPKNTGYGRINDWCGAMDFELVEKNKHYTKIIDSDRYYTILNRRDIADALRDLFANS